MLLGLDLGTTNVKALLVTEDGTITSRGSAPVPLHHVADGGVEQDIEEIWRATLDAIRRAGEVGDLSAVRAIGISSQGAAIQVRAPDGRCTGPVISWMDPRGAASGQRLVEQLGVQWFSDRAGHGNSGIAVGQVQRLRAANPDTLAWPNRLGFVGDTIVQRLCGRAAHDHSSLSITGFYNPSLQTADPELMERIALRPDQLPDLQPAREPAGLLTPDAAEKTSLPVGVPVSAAIHDQYAAALGSGAINAGDVMFGAGTAWALLAVADHLMKPIVPSAYVCDHVVPQRWGQMLSLVVGGSVFKWALELSRLADASAKTIDEMIDSVPPGSEGLRVLPFLDGAGGHERPTCGMLDGLKFAHGRAHLVRATVEGLCFELARQLRWLTESECPVSRLIMCGGVTQTRSTPQIVADVTGCPASCPDEPEVSAFGAAIVARAMLEPEAPLETLSRSMTEPGRVIEPGPAASYYAPKSAEYVEAVRRQLGWLA